MTLLQTTRSQICGRGRDGPTDWSSFSGRFTSHVSRSVDSTAGVGLSIHYAWLHTRRDEDGTDVSPAWGQDACVP